MITPDRQTVQESLTPSTASGATVVFEMYGYDTQKATDLIVNAISLDDGQFDSIGIINGGECFINNRLEIVGGANFSPRHKKLSTTLINYAQNNLGF